MMGDFQTFMELFRKVYLRPVAPSFAEAYRHARRHATEQCLKVPSIGQVRQRFKREAPIKTGIGDATKGYAPRAHVAISQNEKTNLFDLCGDDGAMAELLARLRHRRIERAKEVLKIIQSVQLDGLPSDDDPAFDALAQRFAVLLFGEK